MSTGPDEEFLRAAISAGAITHEAAIAARARAGELAAAGTASPVWQILVESGELTAAQAVELGAPAARGAPGAGDAGGAGGAGGGGGSGSSPPSRSASASANTHGLPVAPRPMRTRSQPHSLSIRTASWALQTEPLPPTGTAQLSARRAMCSQWASAR